ncbi:hypothetical protein AXG93_3960s1110 [Marchantia polymorpha subsp. ruderalis]|uniref:Uncharacterized protein n=1 Tax=Marchantia polymorpha subsp. ruderalis TaxID=1480154 RepID=A0A176VIN3_MARPO|nr:hypothetical protein AXG93_3960s1110 [Marchantia polymorpha subsp. ruderalis]
MKQTKTQQEEEEEEEEEAQAEEYEQFDKRPEPMSWRHEEQERGPGQGPSGGRRGSTAAEGRSIECSEFSAELTESTSGEFPGLRDESESERESEERMRKQATKQPSRQPLGGITHSPQDQEREPELQAGLNPSGSIPFASRPGPSSFGHVAPGLPSCAQGIFRCNHRNGLAGAAGVGWRRLTVTPGLDQGGVGAPTRLGRGHAVKAVRCPWGPLTRYGAGLRRSAGGIRTCGRTERRREPAAGSGLSRWASGETATMASDRRCARCLPAKQDRSPVDGA